MKNGLRFALDMAPLLVFFLCYRIFLNVPIASYEPGQRTAIMVATAMLVVTTVLSLVITYVIEKKISPMPLVSGIAVTVFGGLTLYLHNDIFIKMKPTMVNLLFATILLGGLFFKRPMLKYVLHNAIHLRDEGWNILTLRWGLFFIFLAALNELIWRNFSQDFWVNFKVFGMFTCTMLFTFCQFPLMKKYMVEPSA